MPEFDNPDTFTMLLRKPSASGGALTTEGTVCYAPVDGDLFVLENALVNFTLQADDVGGIYLKSFGRQGTSAHTWTNVCRDLWRVRVFDTINSVNRLAVQEIRPQAPDFTTDGVVDDGSGNLSIVLVWTDALVSGPDTITVTLSLSLNKNEDFLTGKITAAWSGTTATYALDNLSVLPLRVQPFNMGDDVACEAAVTGVRVKNPIVKFRYDYDGNPSNLKGGFRANRINNLTYPMGPELRMPVLGYYETLTREGWMFWPEDHSNEQLYITYQSDGFNMELETSIPQPDLLKVANNGQTLGSSYTFCLRPFLATTRHGWYDIALQYRRRLELKKPYFFQPVRSKDTRLGDAERKPFLLGQIIQTSYTGDHTVLVDRFNKIREKMGVGLDFPVFVNASFDHSKNQPNQPFNKAAGTTRKAILKARANEIFVAVHQFGQFYPYPYDARKWPDTNDAWVDKDILHGSRRYRGGLWEGGGDGRWGPQGNYFTAITRTVISFNPTSGILTFTPPLGHEFDGVSADDMSYIVYHVRPDNSKVLLQYYGPLVAPFVGATSQKFTAPFFQTMDYIPEYPQLGDQVVIFTGGPELCLHATLGSNYMDWVKKYTWAGMLEIFGAGAFYADVETGKVGAAFQGDNRIMCCDDHALWTQLFPDYVPHPQGGGAWHKTAHNQFFQILFDYLRQRSLESRGQSVGFLMSEYHDESVAHLITSDVQGGAQGRDWRNGPDATDFANSGFLMVPMFSVVYSGRCYAFMYNNLFTNGILTPEIRNGLITGTAFSKGYIRQMAAWMLTDWPLGMVPITFAQYMDARVDATGYDLWNEAEYEAGHPMGAADPEIKLVRDSFINTLKLEKNFLFKYMREGLMLPPPELGPLTTYTTAPHNASIPTLAGPLNPNVYFITPNIWEADQFPAVTPGAYVDEETGWVAVALSNWTYQQGTIDATYDMAVYGLPTNQPVSVFQIQEDGAPGFIGSYTGSSIHLKTTLAPYQTAALLFVPTAQTTQIKTEVSNLKVRPTFIAGQLKITWDMPAAPASQSDLYSYPKVKEVVLVRKQSGYPVTVADGEVVYRGTGTEFLDENLQQGQPYHYTAFIDSGEIVTTL